MQLEASDEVYAALPEALIGVGVIAVRDAAGKWVAGSAKRVRRAWDFAAWLSTMNITMPEVWTFTIDGRVGDSKPLPDVFHSPFHWRNLPIASEFAGTCLAASAS